MKGLKSWRLIRGRQTVHIERSVQYKTKRYSCSAAANPALLRPGTFLQSQQKTQCLGTDRRMNHCWPKTFLLFLVAVLKQPMLNHWIYHLQGGRGSLLMFIMQIELKLLPCCGKKCLNMSQAEKGILPVLVLVAVLLEQVAPGDGGITIPEGV